MPLTPEAQAAIDEAVRIVREDRREAMLKAMHDKMMAGGNTPPTDPAGPPAPPTQPPTAVPPAPEGPAPKRDAYWGELLS